MATRAVTLRRARILVALCCVACGLLVPPTSALASNSFSNSSIAEIAETYPEGSLQGQCIVFVANVLKQASGNTISLSAYAWGYQGTYPHFGGVQVGAAEATRGDIIQVTPPGSSDSQGAELDNGPLHTAIIRQNLGGGNFSVIDSNFAYNERVARHNVSLGSWAGDVVKIWRMGQVSDGGGGIEEGSYVQVSGHGEVFKIVGGAPLYVSSWNAVGGSQPVTTISQQQFDALRPYPADGTLVNTTNDGRVYEFAGGAPLYVSSWSAIGGPKSTIPIDGWDVANPGNPAAHVREYPADGTLINTTNDGKVYEIAGGAPLYVSSWSAIGGSRPSVAVDGWDVANVGNPYAHLRPVPADGTLVATTNDGRVYEIAGGAPLYVSSWSAIGGPRPATGIDGWDVANPGNPAAHLREYPADGTLINTTNDGRVYVVAGGAPLYLSSWSAIGGSRPSVAVDGWDVANVGNPYAHLRPYPADGTFLNTSTGRVYRVAGGAPIAVSNWSVFGGVQPNTTVDQWDVDNESSPYAHLRSAPLDGTEVEGLPSHSYWLFNSGLRSPSPEAPGAVAVDDAGLAAFPMPSSRGVIPGSVATSSHAAASSGVAATSKKHKSCQKIRNHHKRARCISATRHRKHRKAHGRREGRRKKRR